MSTRATYQFNCGFKKEPVIYLHHDGYPEGAADYFYNMFICENKKGSFFDTFHRANDRAEITESHESHGDTEYRYTLNDDGHLTAEKLTDGETYKFEAFFCGSYIEFINKYTKHNIKMTT